MPHGKRSIVKQIAIVIKGAGEMATGVAVRLRRAGFGRLVMLEVPAPTAVRRAVSFCEAVYDGRQEVEGIAAVRLDDAAGLERAWADGAVPILVDPEWTLLSSLRPEVSVDAVLAKKNLGTRLDEAPLVIALGPGFIAGMDAHYVIETNRGHDLGRVLDRGAAEPNTGVPGIVGGFGLERVLRSPAAGRVEGCREIGDAVKAGEVVCRVGGADVPARLDGVLRGLVRDGLEVGVGFKLGDVDSRGKREYCFTVSEKARALGGAVLEAVCAGLPE